MRRAYRITVYETEREYVKMKNDGMVEGENLAYTWRMMVQFTETTWKKFEEWKFLPRTQGKELD